MDEWMNGWMDGWMDDAQNLRGMFAGLLCCYYVKIILIYQSEANLGVEEIANLKMMNEVEI